MKKIYNKSILCICMFDDTNSFSSKRNILCNHSKICEIFLLYQGSGDVIKGPHNSAKNKNKLKN